MQLADRRCEACEGGIPPLADDEADFLIQDGRLKWTRIGSWIHRDLTFRDFVTAVSFVRDVADLAQDEGHHPDILIHGYRNVKLSLQTHAVGGLTDNDMILAAKIDRLHRSQHA